MINFVWMSVISVLKNRLPPIMNVLNALTNRMKSTSMRKKMKDKYKQKEAD